MTTTHPASAAGEATARGGRTASTRGLLLVIAIILGGIGNLTNILFGYTATT